MSAVVPTLPEPILRLGDVHKSYNVGTPVETEVLHGIDLVLAPGEFAALIGPSGSGKSTLLNIIGLLERPTAGSVRLAGKETTRLDDAGITQLRGRTLGFIFQFHHLIAAFSALENVMMPLMLDRGRTEPHMRETALGLLEAVGLKADAQKKPSELSAGCSSEWRSPGRWQCGRRSCSPTSPPATSTRRRPTRSLHSCGASTSSTARRSSS